MVIAITNQKGGVGKTTTSINLSAALSELGNRVLLIDFDPQGNSSSGLGITRCKRSIYDALTDNADINNCICATPQKNLDIIPSNISLAGAELELATIQNREYILKNIIAKISKQYDHIFIDCPPSLSLLTINALTAAESVIIPIQCEYYALEGVTSLMNTIARVKSSFNAHLEIDGIILTMLDGRTNLGLQVVESVKKHFKNKVYSIAIPRNVRLSEAPSHGLPINQYDNKSIGNDAYMKLAKEFIKRQGKHRG